MDKSLITAEEAKKEDIKELFQKLSSNAKGFTSSEYKERLQQYGYNEIVEHRKSLILKLLSYFWGPIPWMIEIAAILSAVVHHWEDFWIIFVLLLLNAIVGFWQEHKADNAIELLKQKLAPKARVLRDGKWIEVDAKELVPGDVVRVRLGVIIPAEATQIIGTLIAVYGVFMHPIGWKLAGFVWGYALVFFVVNDFIKVRICRILNHRGLVFQR
jgi:H+-transporting ATPase